MQEYLTLARPYAKAAFEFALENKAISAWQQFLQVAAEVLKNPQTAAFLRDPTATEGKLLELLEGVLGEQADSFRKNFLKLLASYKRLTLLPTIFRVFHEFKAEHEKQVDVDVFSASPLTSAQLQQLSQKLETRLHRKVALHEHLDVSLLGGFLVRAGDFVIDGSVRGRLQRLTHALTD